MTFDPTTSDHELLQRYFRDHQEDAFAELMQRYLGFVHASAGRQVGPELAPDVAQAVFLVLARKAGTLGPGTVLSSWLFRTTRFVAARARRAETRRSRRELVAAGMSSPLESHFPQSHESDGLASITPHLDDALAALPEADRRLVLSRFLEAQEFPQLGRRFGVSSEAARKRVTRALERMRAFLAARGVSISATGLAVVLPRFRAEAAPATLAAEVMRQLRAIPAPSAPPPSGTAAESTRGWVEGALTDWTRLAIRQGALRFATAMLAIALVLGGVVLVLPIKEPRANPAPSFVPTPLNTAAGEPAVRAAEQPAGPRLPDAFRLQVVSEPTGVALANADVAFDFWDDARVIRSEASRTSVRGECLLALREPTLRLLRVWVSAPGHVPVVMDWHRHELRVDQPPYLCRLARGQALRGLVRNEAGEPIAEAVVRFREPGLDLSRRENIGFHPRLTRVQTDNEGRFVSDQMPKDWTTSTLGILVWHPDYTPSESSFADSRAWSTNYSVVLGSGVAVRGRVTDENGAPVVAATVRNNGGDAWPEDRTLTDIEGRFEFGHVAPGTFPFRVEAKGFDTYDGVIEAASGTRNTVVQLVAAQAQSAIEPANRSGLRSVRLLAQVQDARTGAPIPRFQILIAEDGANSRRLLGDGFDGTLDWTINATYFQDFALEVEAEGYLPLTTEQQTTRTNRHSFEFRLEPGEDVSGVVLQPDGRPASGARVALAGRARGLAMTQRPGELEGGGEGARTSVTDAAGHFRLRRGVGLTRLQVAHPTGSAFPPLETFKDSPIVLAPWSTVEGRLPPRARQVRQLGIHLGRCPEGPDRAIESFDFGYTTYADAEGFFRFTHVPAGTMRLSIGHTVLMPDQVFEVPPDTTVQIDPEKE